ncbi:MAG TPA: proton-translocating transhydrogenase family protein, partial [Tetrasphaera sp.]|uniref:proton-translocating transhydrogenase family protein n=1 Tax=Nostocoides sp. TaxID=1917966 RepID=UPI002B842FAB
AGAGAAAAAAVAAKPEKVVNPNRKFWVIGIVAAAFLLLSTILPGAFLPHFTVFVLAVVIGYYVIGNVHHALHTPLMSVTNAISGIIVVGALLQVPSDNPAIKWVAFVAILLASINVFGGFTVTQRMLNMFRKA